MQTGVSSSNLATCLVGVIQVQLKNNFQNVLFSANCIVMLQERSLVHLTQILVLCRLLPQELLHGCWTKLDVGFYLL